MSRAHNVLVFGATGIIGRYIVDELAKSSLFARLAIFTSQTTADQKASEIAQLKDRGVEVIIGDVTSEEQVKNAYKGFDTVVSAAGRAIIDKQIPLIQWAEDTPDIKRFYPSEYGTDIEYDASSANEKPHQQKLKVRAYIRDHVRRLSYTYLVTGPFAEMYMDTSLQEKAGTFDVPNRKAVLIGDGNAKISLTTMPDVGKLLVASLQHPQASHNKALKVNSFTTTPREILKQLQRQVTATAKDGDQAWDVKSTSMSELEQLEDQMWAEGNPYATLFTLRRIWAQGRTLYDRTDNESIGNPRMERLEEVIQRTVKGSS